MGAVHLRAVDPVALSNLDCPFQKIYRYHRRAPRFNWITDPLRLSLTSRAQRHCALTAWAKINHSTTELSIFKGRDSGQSDHVVLSQPRSSKLTVPSQPLNFPLRFKRLRDIKRNLIFDNVVTSPAELVRHCFDGHNRVALGFLFLIRSF